MARQFLLRPDTIIVSAGGTPSREMFRFLRELFDRQGDTSGDNGSGFITGTAGTANDLAKWNTSGDLVDGPTPPDGAIVGTNDAQTLTNKSIDGDNNTLSDIATASLKTRTGSDSAVVTGTAGTSGNLAQWNADGDAVDSSVATSNVLQSSDIGSSVQAWNADLDAIADLSSADGNFIVGSASGWVVESGATARASLGLVIGTDVQAYDADLDTWATKTAPSGTVVGTSDAQTLSSKTFSDPPIFPEYTVATLPSAATYDNGVIIVSDETGGRTLATSDGANWRRVSDGAVVS